MLKSKKADVVTELKEMFASNQALMLVHYHGLNMPKMAEFRRKLRGASTKLFVVKNTLTRIAIQDTSFASLDKHLQGPVALISTNNPIEVAKIFVSFAGENEVIKFVCGYVFGREMDLKGVKILSTMPSLDELRAKIVGLLKAPATSLVSILSAPSGGVARVLNAYSKSK